MAIMGVKGRGRVFGRIAPLNAYEVVRSQVLRVNLRVNGYAAGC